MVFAVNEAGQATYAAFDQEDANQTDIVCNTLTACSHVSCNNSTRTKTLSVTATATAAIINCAFCAASTSLQTNLFNCNDVYSAGTITLSNGFQFTDSNSTVQFGLMCIDPDHDMSINVFDYHNIDFNIDGRPLQLVHLHWAFLLREILL